jgi:murein DD-endopeptidase MepM/ murein hydrolase activator NlpD
MACISTDGSKKVTFKQNHETCPIGSKSLYSLTDGHNGLDLMAYRWQPCYNAQEGYVVEVSTEEARGLGVSVITKEKYFCNELGYSTQFIVRYWHFIANNVHVGDYVNVGDLLGYCDSTGYSSGDHLHWELKPVKVTKEKDGVPTKWTNLYEKHLGAVDPLQYTENIFALDFAGVWKKTKELIALTADYIADKLRY